MIFLKQNTSDYLKIVATTLNLQLSAQTADGRGNPTLPRSIIINLSGKHRQIFVVIYAKKQGATNGGLLNRPWTDAPTRLTVIPGAGKSQAVSAD
jgi:hypothetical protein